MKHLTLHLKRRLEVGGPVRAATNRAAGPEAGNEQVLFRT